MRPDHKRVISVAEPQRWFVLCGVKSQFLKMLHENVAKMDDRRNPIAMPFLLEELVHLQIFGSQAHLQQLHVGSICKTAILLIRSKMWTKIYIRNITSNNIYLLSLFGAS
jgi:hypothetical protein